MVLSRVGQRQERAYARDVTVFHRALCAGLLCASLSHCASTHSADRVSGASAPRRMLVGLVSQEEILASEPRWQSAYARTQIDPETARALSSVRPGATVDVYLGTWCGDSVREVTRLFRYLETGAMPFSVRWIAVDRDKRAPGLTDGVGLERVPTFVVQREGREVGRVIETPANELGADLLALLR